MEQEKQIPIEKTGNKDCCDLYAQMIEAMLMLNHTLLEMTLNAERLMLLPMSLPEGKTSNREKQTAASELPMGNMMVQTMQDIPIVLPERTRRMAYTNNEAAKDDASVAEQVLSVASSTGSLLEEVAKVNPALSKIKPAVSAANGALKTVSAASKIWQFAEGATGLAEGLLAMGEMASGVAGIAEILTGPYGLLLAGGSMIVGAMMGDDIDERKRKQREEAMRGPMPSDDFRMPEWEGEQFSNELTKLATETKVRVSKPYTGEKKRFDTYHQITQEQGVGAMTLQFEAPRPATDATEVQMPFSPLKQVAEKELLKQPTTFAQRNADVQTRLYLAGIRGGKDELKLQYTKELAEAKHYDGIHKTNTSQEVLQTAYLMLPSLLVPANNGKGDIKELYYPAAKQQSNNRGQAARGGGVTLHLHGPMIGSFSVHTQTTDKAMGDVRAVVEKVLLDVLYSANVI